MNVELRRMSPAEFDVYWPEAILAYADSRIRTDDLKRAAALRASREIFQDLLPHGLKTKRHFLYTIFFRDLAIGSIWLGSETKSKAFVYDLVLRPEHRGRGFGEAAMRALEKEAHAKGFTQLSLHVFGDNTKARRLYEKLGYETVNVRMKKRIISET